MRSARVDAPWGTLALDLQVATRMGERLKGWMGRRGIGARDALLIRPCSSVHTFFMAQPIDVVFLDAHDVVLAVHPAVPPRRVRAHWRAAATLELCAGRGAQLRIVPGLALDIVNRGEEP
ncbi:MULTISPECIES: DUF192 domain-containing protein [Burkholderia]|uniref:DUF192 domain-containing protein n=1 Tax=Burkholderia TaxID=32008 RepID=UPI000BF55322|nr:MULTISPECIES: DUF192 domain-containing protein [Burkholderia]PFH21000.1 hypothetical protein BX604_5425 [Burkholderia sp. JKS000303]